MKVIVEVDENDELVDNLLQHNKEFQDFLDRRVEEDKKHKPLSIEEVRKRLLGE